MLLSAKICFRETARTKQADVIMMNFVKFSPMKLYHFSLSSEKCGVPLLYTFISKVYSQEVFSSLLSFRVLPN